MTILRRQCLAVHRVYDGVPNDCMFHRGGPCWPEDHGGGSLSVARTVISGLAGPCVVIERRLLLACHVCKLMIYVHCVGRKPRWVGALQMAQPACMAAWSPLLQEQMALRPRAGIGCQRVGIPPLPQAAVPPATCCCLLLPMPCAGPCTCPCYLGQVACMPGNSYCDDVHHIVHAHRCVCARAGPNVIQAFGFSWLLSSSAGHLLRWPNP